MAMLVFKSCLGKLVWSGHFVVLDLFWKWQNWLCLSWKNFWINFVCCVPVLKWVPMQQGCVWKRWLLVLLCVGFPYLHKKLCYLKGWKKYNASSQKLIQIYECTSFKGTDQSLFISEIVYGIKSIIVLGGKNICLYFHNCKYKNKYISRNV